MKKIKISNILRCIKSEFDADGTVENGCKIAAYYKPASIFCNRGRDGNIR
ncbi:MAG: hypothetical protein J6D26_06520 [Clostridia bacterium]|nr:hypothetical protein [Clostridia bacterium]